MKSISIGKLTSADVSFTRLHSEPNENPPEFTLTCVSEGGPATAVVWERNGEPVQEDSNHETSQIIVDRLADTVYHNRLRVRGREGGEYMCTVSNNIQVFVSSSSPSSTSEIFSVEGTKMKNSETYNLHHYTFVNALVSLTHTVAETPSEVRAVYKSVSSILLEWTYPQINIGFTYVVVYYNNIIRNVSVSSGVNTNLLEELSIEGVDSISIVAMSHLPSDVVGPVNPGIYTCRYM